MNNNGRPLSRKQTARILTAMVLVVWATQTLLKQWGYGAEISAAASTRSAPVSDEKFVPAPQLYPTGATLELRSEATVVGSEVTLRQVCRWSDRDKSFFDPIGDLVLVRLGSQAPFKAISLPEVRGLLRDAGVNAAAINFAGAASCTVSRSDVQYNEKVGLQQWIEAKEAVQAKNAQAGTIAAAPATTPATSPAEREASISLRTALIADLANRMNLAPELLQVSFKSQDDKVLNISEPLFKYSIEANRAKSLGNVSWTVTISSGTEAGAPVRKVIVQAEAKAWQEQVVTAKPMAFKQVITKEDLVSRRTLVDQIGDEPLMTLDQVVGQQTSRDLKPGVVLTGKMIDPVQLVKNGQFISVMLEQGSVKIKTVARAMESGGKGQTIRVKNEMTKEVFQVILTGPGEASMNLSAPVSASAQ